MKAIALLLAAVAAWQVPGYFFPHRLRLDCPTEACVLGRWIACADTPVRERPGTSQWLVGQVPKGARFPVVGAELLTLEPGVVRVNRDVEQAGRLFKTGETLILLGRVGEGFYFISSQGRSGTIEVFWPWKRQSGVNEAAELIRDAVTERWMQTTITGKPGWVLDDGTVLSPAGQVEPLKCPAGQ